MSGKEEKSPLGPIMGPNPGTTFEIEVAAPDMEVIKFLTFYYQSKQKKFLIKIVFLF